MQRLVVLAAIHQCLAARKPNSEQLDAWRMPSSWSGYCLSRSVYENAGPTTEREARRTEANAVRGRPPALRPHLQVAQREHRRPSPVRVLFNDSEVQHHHRAANVAMVAILPALM